MEKTVKYTDEASRQQALDDNSRMVLLEDRRHGDGNSLVFGDEPRLEESPKPTDEERLTALEARADEADALKARVKDIEDRLPSPDVPI